MPFGSRTTERKYAGLTEPASPGVWVSSYENLGVDYSIRGAFHQAIKRTSPFREFLNAENAPSTAFSSRNLHLLPAEGDQIKSRLLATIREELAPEFYDPERSELGNWRFGNSDFNYQSPGEAYPRAGNGLAGIRVLAPLHGELEVHVSPAEDPTVFTIDENNIAFLRYPVSIAQKSRYEGRYYDLQSPGGALTWDLHSNL
jgi:hypothetical protein